MTKSTLKSSTAFSVMIALAAPAPLVAQNANGAFPCIAPSGAEVSSIEDLAADIANVAQSGAAPSADMSCASDLVPSATVDAESTPEPEAIEEPVAEPEVARSQSP